MLLDKHPIQKVYEDTSLFKSWPETSTLHNMIATTCSVQRKQCPIAHGTSGFCYQASEYSVKFFGGEFKLKMHCNQCSSKIFFQAG